ncbi:MAG: hypothetical protein EOO13_03650 [Chitinophagaceae bacterium]|nr:MAG: hypothetical protein EOO13_03650 [Chitinophagaceae bacterium]
MGTISKGILGGFSGTVGTVVGGNWKGIDYIRSKGEGRRNNHPSPAQLAQQLKFGIGIRFLQSVSQFIAVGFNQYAIKKTSSNVALRYLLKNAITGVFPTYGLSYADVMVSRGDLPNAGAPVAAMGTGSILTFSWTDNTGMGIARAADQAMLLAYCPDLKQAVYTTAGASRSALTDSLNLAQFAGRQVHTFIGFKSENNANVATSIYTGQYLVS